MSDPRVTLTEAEQDALIRAVTNPDDSCVHNVAPLMRAVERIIAARLAPIRAMVTELMTSAREEWDAHNEYADDGKHDEANAAGAVAEALDHVTHSLRAALDGDQ